MSDKKRKTFTLEEKAAIIFRLEGGESNKNIAKEMGVSHSTISTIYKSKEKIKENFEQDNFKLKKIRKSGFDDIDKCLIDWFKVQRSKNIAISGPLLEIQANKFARLLRKTDFECSPSWVQRFRSRHNIVLGKISGEAADVNVSTVNNWMKHVWPTIRAGYTDDQIFNMDETGLFYKLTPDKTLFKGEKCVGGKMSKERITVLVGANMTGKEKLKLMVIGKSKNPRCFKGVKNLPVSYESNKRAWILSDLFERYLRKWDEDLTRKFKKIILLVDNCPAHPKVDNLRSIKLVFLPPNTTSVLQPMDQGVIKSLKVHYRRLLMHKFVLQSPDESRKDINLLDAIILLDDAWKRVSEQTIANCFSHAGFNGLQTQTSRTDPDDDISLAELANQLKHQQGIELHCSWDEFVSIDNEVITSTELSEEEIIERVNSKNLPENDDDDDGNVEEDFPVQAPDVSQAIAAIEIVKRYYLFNECNEETSDSIDKIKRKLEEDLCQSRQTQTSITKYFVKQ